MVKFKSRSCLKQYLPLKSVKEGKKISDADMEYNFNICAGNEDSKIEDTLGERVVNKLVLL